MHYSFKSTPTFSFKSRTQIVTKSNQLSSFPGPFQYTVSKPLHKSGTAAKTKEKRQLWKTIDLNPGPGSYQPKSFITAGQKRSMSARYFRDPKKTPGPFQYDTNTVKVKSKAPIFTLGQKSKSPERIIAEHNIYKPAPTNYQAKYSFLQGVGTIFGTSTRKDLTETERTPAPVAYTAEKVKQVHVLNPRCSIGEQKRELKIAVFQETPGPGAYNKLTFTQENKHSKRGFTCKQKVRNLVAEELSRMPAPNQYKSQILTFKNLAPRCATTQTKRKTFMDDIQEAKKDIPGLSTSQVNFFNHSKYRSSSINIFSKSNRKSLDQNQKTPGPVVYKNDKISILYKKPSFSCPKQSKSKSQFLKYVDPQNPGPGQYDSKLDLVKDKAHLAITMKELRPTFEKEREKPGVGQYNLVKDQKAKFGYTQEKRISFTDLKNQAKNGTHYNLNTNVSNPPSYMKVSSKIKYNQMSPTKSLGLASTGF